MFGKLLAAPFRILNVPLKAIEKIAAAGEDPEPILSAPLDAVAESVEEALDGEDE